MALGVAVSAACASPGRGDARIRPAAERRVATMDSATARRVCAAPDSVLAGRAACVLRDQRHPARVF
jgi:hypothetical protein